VPGGRQGLFFHGLAPGPRAADTVGRATGQGGVQFAPATPNGLDVQAGDAGQQAVPATSNLLGLQRRQPTALVLVQAAQQEVQPPVDFLVRVFP